MSIIGPLDMPGLAETMLDGTLDGVRLTKPGGVFL